MDQPTNDPTDLPAPAPVLGFLLVHVALRREMADVVAAADAGAPDLERRLALFDRVIRAHHHGEDRVLLPVLRSREPEIRSAADEVEVDHEHLDAALDRLRASVGHGSPGTVRDDVRDLAGFLDRHLELEETRLLPVWLEALDPADHERFARRLRRATPLRAMSVMVPWLMDSVPDGFRAAAERELPPAIRFAYRHGLQARFARRWRGSPTAGALAAA